MPSLGGSRWTRGLWIASVNVLVFVGLIVLIEVTVRLFTPAIQPVGMDSQFFQDDVFGTAAGPRPGLTGVSNGVVRTVDARGFWSYTAAQTEKPGWLFLGDSVTMGIGVEADSTFAGRLAALQDSLDVVNASLPGHASNDYLAILQALVDDTDLARVTVFWCLNDIMADLPVATAPTGARELDQAFMTFVRRHVYTYTWLKATFLDRSQAYFLHDKALYDPEEGYLTRVREHLAALRTLARQHNLPLDVVLLPYEYGLRVGDEGPRRTMAALLGELGIDMIDMGAMLSSVDEPHHLYLYGDGIHFSSRGHKLIAERLAEHYRQTAGAAADSSMEAPNEASGHRAPRP